MTSEHDNKIPDYLLQADSALALGYDGEHAPQILAKGREDLASDIISIALQYDIPIYSNPELVRWLSQLSVGDEIPEQYYQIIAELLAFVFHLENREITDIKRST